MNQIEPVNYKVRLEPDLKSFQFKGSVAITLKSQAPVNEIRLNVLDMAIWRCVTKSEDKTVECAFFVDPAKEELRITLPSETVGEIGLTIEYAGNINDKMAGLYRSQYTCDGKTAYMAVTQFEESDARRMIPCIDRPAAKATFDIELVIDKNLTAISNTVISEESRFDETRKLVKFDRTPRMSTYLLFVGVGEFDYIQETDRVTVRVATIPGFTKYGGLGLDFGRKSLDYCEEYYGVPYPLPKLDLIAVPDFAFGAMENWGAVTFRENLLLDYPEVTSKAGKERICEVIAHEIAHQWFGNLVTPTDWKYLWLNESFATYFGYGAVDRYFPEWKVWDQFLLGQTEGARARDALHETFAIEIPGGEHIVINSSTAPIIYNKGGSILRQIISYIGEDAFKKGLRGYLKKFEYECAESKDLWETFEEISGKPVTSLMKKWVEQPGFPMIEARREGPSLVLTQKRFTYLPNESDQLWPIPVSVRVFRETGESVVETVLVDQKHARIQIGDDAAAYKIDDGQFGFYRVGYADEKNLAALGKMIKTKKLSPQDRWGIESDLFARFVCRDISLNAYLEFLSNYENEDAFLPLYDICGNLFNLYLILRNERKQIIADMGKVFTERILSRIGFEPHPDEDHPTSLLRDRALWPAVLYGSETVIDFTSKRFGGLMRGDTVHSDIMRSVMQAGAHTGDASVFDWFVDRLESTESEHERMNILIAMGCFRDLSLIGKAREYVLDSVPNRNKYIPLAAMIGNPHAIPSMWDWYLKNRPALEAFHPLHYERVIETMVPVCGILRYGEIRPFFEKYMEENPKYADIVKLSLERLEINVRMGKTSEVSNNPSA